MRNGLHHLRGIRRPCLSFETAINGRQTHFAHGTHQREWKKLRESNTAQAKSREFVIWMGRICDK